MHRTLLIGRSFVYDLFLSVHFQLGVVKVKLNEMKGLFQCIFVILFNQFLFYYKIFTQKYLLFLLCSREVLVIGKADLEEFTTALFLL